LGTTDHVATDDGHDLTLEEDYVLPFVSNEQQRRVIRAAEHCGVVLVSGPPGTGKSQTIANLVCHLVARGQRVLVSSQKDKALEVVSEKLAELKTDYLFLTLLKDDAESKKMLADSIEALSSHIEGLSDRGLLEAQKRLEEERAKERRLAGQVRADFDNLQAIEHEYGSAYQRYADVKPFDLIPPYDHIEENAGPEVVEALRKAVELQLACVNEFGQLDAWYERANEIVDTEVLPVLCDSLRRVGHLGRSVLELLKNDHVRLVLDRLNRDARFGPEMAESVRGAIPAVRHVFEQWLVKLLRLAAQDSDGHWCDVAAGLSKGRPDDLDRFRVLLDGADSAARQAFGLREFRDRFAGSMSDVDELEVVLDEFRETYRKPLRILNPSFRRCRRRLLAGYPGLRKKRAEDDAIKVIGKWISYWKSRRVADSRCAALSPNLPGGLSQLIDGDMAGWSAELALRTLVVDVAEAESQARVANDGLACDLFVLEDMRRLESLGDLSIVLADAEAALGIVSSVWEMERLLERTALQSLGGPLGPLMKAVNRLSPDDGVSCDALDTLAEALPHFCGLVQLLRGPLGSLPGFAASLTTDARMTREAPVVLANLDQVIEAYRLRNLISRLDSEFPRTTQELAGAMRDRRQALLDNSRRLLQVVVNRRLFEAYSGKSVAADIHYFRRTIRKGRRSYKRFEELKREFNFQTLLTIFPCWIMGLEDVCRVFPLQPGLFDFVIIDEASQCHQPGGLPVLVRAKKAIIVGDEKQLPNADVTWLPDAVNQVNYQRYGIHELPRSNLFDAKESSLLDLCTVFADVPPVFLNEHFRSYPEIIRFSNERIYNGRLRIATDSAHNPYGRILNVVHVEGAEEDTSRRVNLNEAVRLADDLVSLMEDPRYSDASFGVLSLFREQTAQLQRVLEEKLAGKPDLWERHRLIVATVDGFQGDERDVILYSFRYGLGSSRNILMPLQRSENRMNVAFTRARGQVFCYISRPIHEFPRGLVRDFLEYASAGGAGRTAALQDRFDSDFEREVCELVRARGLDVFPQYPACGFSIDLVVSDEDGRRLAVECDGQKYHYDDLGELRIEDLQRQDILERAGWHVFRIPSRAYFLDRESWIQRVVDELRALPAPFAEAAATTVEPTPAEVEEAETLLAPETPARGQEVTPEVPVAEAPRPTPRQVTPPGAVAHQPILGWSSQTWKQMAKWGKDTGKLNPVERRFSFQVGQLASWNKQPSEKQLRWATELQRKAVDLGFQPE
jgi:very-short-patch-repair endonuclease